MPPKTVEINDIYLYYSTEINRKRFFFENSLLTTDGDFFCFCERTLSDMSVDYENIFRKFSVEGSFSGATPFGNGHINDTYSIDSVLPDGSIKRYVLQRVNTFVFRDVDGLMENISKVTRFLVGQLTKAGRDPDKEAMQVIPAVDGSLYHRDDVGNCWRMLSMVENTISLQQAQSNEDFYEAAVAFGRFQHLLSGYDAKSLVEVIPFFHYTPKRFSDLEAAIERDAVGRVKEVGPEIRFALERKKEVSVLTDLLEKKELPLHVTHNDTKLNNVLFDKETRKGVCVIDLDTVMPGLCHYDYGDAIRFGASTAEEDETNLKKVKMDLSLFEIFTRGFLEETIDSLSDAEIRTLPWGAKLMTFECGMRFLTDFLEGDAYFKINRPVQNLDRARNQFALVSDMEEKWDKMHEIIENVCENIKVGRACVR